jgi:hypothetical protein
MPRTRVRGATLVPVTEQDPTGDARLRDESPDPQAPTAPPPVVDAIQGDVLPDDLDLTKYVGPYTFPNVRRRRIAGTLHAILGAICVAGALAVGNDGVLVGGIVLLAIAAWHWITAWDVRFDETDALVEATKAVGFPVGHASAQLQWRGFLSRPTWRILCYSADDPPTRRGQVALDAVDGEIIGVVAEANPEDWSQLSPA